MNQPWPLGPFAPLRYTRFCPSALCGALQEGSLQLTDSIRCIKGGKKRKACISWDYSIGTLTVLGVDALTPKIKNANPKKVEHDRSKMPWSSWISDVNKRWWRTEVFLDANAFSESHRNSNVQREKNRRHFVWTEFIVFTAKEYLIWFYCSSTRSKSGLMKWRWTLR